MKITLWRGMEVDAVIAKTLSTLWGKMILVLLTLVDMFALIWFFILLLQLPYSDIKP
jgi:hypothetical protein